MESLALKAALLLAVLWGLASASPAQSWRGQVLRHPETISGTWEAKEGSSFVGLTIHLVTRVEGQPKTLRGVPQRFVTADIEVYQRRSAERVTGDGSWYQDTTMGVRWEGLHLILHPSRFDFAPETDLDLVLDPRTERWTGRFHRGAVNRTIVLTRPGYGARRKASRLVGTWRREGLANNCLHIAQDEDGALVAWSDDLFSPGQVRYANGLQPPNETLEEFGSMAQISSPSLASVLVEMKALRAACCSVLAAGKLVNGNSLVGDSGVWTRVHGSSCITDAAVSVQREFPRRMTTASVRRRVAGG